MLKYLLLGLTLTGNLFANSITGQSCVNIERTSCTVKMTVNNIGAQFNQAIGRSNGGFNEVTGGCANSNTCNQPTTFPNGTTEFEFEAMEGETHSYALRNFPTLFNASSGVVRCDIQDGTTAPCDVVLPIELKSFTGSYSSNSVTLNWKTSAESNLKEFKIQKLNPETGDYQVIGTIRGDNNPNGSEYSFIDINITAKNPAYRLKSIDFDNTSELSEIISVKTETGSNTNIRIFPNPTSDFFKVNFDSDDLATVNIFNVDGRSIKIFQNVVSNQELRIDRLEIGTYIVRVDINGNVSSYKLIKK
jgi:hypothetical protein